MRQVRVGPADQERPGVLSADDRLRFGLARALGDLRQELVQA